ncbi:(UPF0240) [Diplonema papillatum]|nr:(UPF0240) [Diplonema papillatum]
MEMLGDSQDGWRRSGAVALNMQRVPERSLAQMKMLISGLKSRNDERRAEITRKIRGIVEDLKKGSPDDFNRVMQEVNQIIFKLVQEEPVDLWSGTAAIEALLDVVDPTAAQLAQLSNYTRLALLNADKSNIAAAVRTLGRLAKKGGVLTANYIELEARTALDTLAQKDVKETKLFGAILIIREIASCVPALFFSYVEKCIRVIWVAIRDPNPVIREVGADALRKVLDLIAIHSDVHNNSSLYLHAWEQCIAGLRSRESHMNHGALLCIGDIFLNSGHFLLRRFEETYQALMSLKDNSHVSIRVGVLRAIPIMTRYARSDFFKQLFLRDTVGHLLTVIKKDQKEERSAALVALPEVAAVVGNIAWRPNSEAALQVVKSSIDKKGRLDPCALPCYAKLAGMGPTGSERQVVAFLDSLFVGGVSFALAEALEILMHAFPGLKSKIQSKFLGALSKALSGQAHMASSDLPSQHSWNGNSPTTSSSNLERSLSSSSNTASQLPRTDDIQKALRLLRVFDFQPRDLGPFVRDCIIRFLDDEAPAVRKEAALTCAAIVVPSPYKTSVRAFSNSRLSSTNTSFSMPSGPSLIQKSRPRSPSASTSQNVPVSPISRHPSKGADFGAATSSNFGSHTNSGHSPNYPTAPGTPSARSATAPGFSSNNNSGQHNFGTPSAFSSGAPGNPATLPPHPQPWAVKAATTRGHKGALVAEVVERLLSIAVADPDPQIRRAIYSSLDERFVNHLATEGSLRTLFISLNDEVFEIRLLVTEMAAKLEHLNPSHVLPCIRKQLLQFLTIVENSVDRKTQNETLQLLTKLVRAAPKVIEMYTLNIITVLKMRMHDLLNDSDVCISVLNCLSALAEAVTEEMLPHLDVFLPLIITVLKGRSSSAKVDAALRALGNLIQFTGHNIKPYEEFGDLLPAILSILKTDDIDGQMVTKREAVKVLGILGALDPYRRRLQIETGQKSSVGGDKAARPAQEAAVGMQISQLGHNNQIVAAPTRAQLQIRYPQKPSAASEVLTLKSTGYFTKVALKSLVSIMVDPTLQQYHKSVVLALVNICRSTKLDHNQILPIIMPPFLHMLTQRGTDTDLTTTKFLLGQISVLVPLCGTSMKPYLGTFHTLITIFFNNQSTLSVVLRLIADLAAACPEDFKAYLPSLLPRVLLILRNETFPDEAISLRCLNILACIGEAMNEFLHQVIPALMEFVSHDGVELPPYYLGLRNAALKTLRKVGRVLRLEDYASAIIHPLLRVLTKPENASLRADIMGIFCIIVHQLGSDYAVFIPIVHKAVTSVHFNNARYSSLIECLMMNQPLPLFPNRDMEQTEAKLLAELLNVNSDDMPMLTEDETAKIRDSEKLQVNQQSIEKAVFDATVVTRDGWNKWVRSFSLELLQQSPYIALRLSANLASQYQPFTRDLFNAAFVSVWDHLSDRVQEEVCNQIERILTNSTLPTEVLGVLLNLVEFMDANDISMPISPQLLSSLATKTSALAKTLRWKEIAYHTAPQLNIEGLVTIYNELSHAQSALGLLRVAEKTLELTDKESWYERLGKWDLALEVLEKEKEEGLQATGVAEDVMAQRQTEIELGMMRCLYALGQWKQLHEMSRAAWEQVGSQRYDQEQEGDDDEDGDSLHHALAPLAVAAAWRMSDWTFMTDTVDKLVPGTYDYYFFKAILSLKSKDDATCQWAIDCARDSLAQELTSVVTEGYDRSYECLIQCQQLAELEEIKLARRGPPELKQLFKMSWMTRLKGCANNVHHWNDILQVRMLLLNPVEDCDTWLKFISLCRNQGKHRLENKTLLLLLGHDHEPDFEPSTLIFNASQYNPRVSFAFFKHMWAVGDKKLAYEHLASLVSLLKSRKTSPEHGLLAKCCLKLGDWMSELASIPTESFEGADTARRAMELYNQATFYDKGWYRAWHAWALANHTQAQESKEGSKQQLEFITAAIRGYVKSITLGPSHASVLQDILRLLTLWFLHGSHESVENAVREGFELITLDIWLLVIPQIIARVHTREPRIAALVCHILCRIGRAFPQSLVYALTVCTKSNLSDRKTAASKVLDGMREHSAVLVEQCEFVSNELIRVAIIWHELWNEGIEEASKLFFGSKDVEGMLRTLFPLHTLMRQTQTLREVSFVQAYGIELEEAFEWCQSYLQTGDEQNIHQAWEVYYSTYKKIRKVIQKDFTSLELPFCSPLLHHARDLDITVPGLPHSRTAIRIKSFNPQVEVMISKQRPRKMSTYGSDGNEYKFLLKGHEDLRLDERVMQLFGLVNALLQSDSATAMKTALQIQRYPVIPLNSNVGLIGWVDDCDTLHYLIKDFREKKKMRINVEYQHMIQLCHNSEQSYDILPLVNKVELFEYAMDCTTGQDLYKVLWLYSGTAEVWLDRRTTYTLSLATMSMVGYILGLGDRHPNNLMLQRGSGKVVHIDFGDCFEVAMHRDKFPEKIPFRLTRMLRAAMEVCGIEGHYWHTCINVMRVLREHKGSVMAMLEAFVHDPLLQWRILRAENGRAPAKNKDKAQQDVEKAKNAVMRKNMILEYLDEQLQAEKQGADTMPPRKDRSADEKELRAASEDPVPATLAHAGTSDDAHKGVQLLKRIDDKLNGKDFSEKDTPEGGLSVNEQVDLLIKQATRIDNLSNCYVGWCPFW